MTATIPFTLERFSFHLKLRNYYSILAEDNTETAPIPPAYITKIIFKLDVAKVLNQYIAKGMVDYLETPGQTTLKAYVDANQSSVNAYIHQLDNTAYATKNLQNIPSSIQI